MAAQGQLKGFEKGLADRGGWREEILPMQEVQASFCTLFIISPLGEVGHTSGDSSCCVLALLVANPLPPTPFPSL